MDPSLWKTKVKKNVAIDVSVVQTIFWYSKLRIRNWHDLRHDAQKTRQRYYFWVNELTNQESITR